MVTPPRRVILLIAAAGLLPSAGCGTSAPPRPVLHRDDRSLAQRAEGVRRTADGALDKLDRYIDNTID